MSKVNVTAQSKYSALWRWYIWNTIITLAQNIHSDSMINSPDFGSHRSKVKAMVASQSMFMFFLEHDILSPAWGNLFQFGTNLQKLYRLAVAYNHSAVILDYI